MATSHDRPTNSRLPFQIGRKLKPGQPGTKKLLREYGDDLVCVRYRYDAAQKRRMKTVELIIEEASWKPRPAKIPLHQIMHLRIKYGEVALGKQVRAAGGKWNREKQAWELPYQEVLKLGLSERIVERPANPQTARNEYETA
jgi:hypothetical protein